MAEALKLIDSLLTKMSTETKVDDTKTNENMGNRPKIIMGTMEFGRFKMTHVKNDKNKLIINVTKKFIGSKNYEMDTAWMYTGGKSEECIGLMKDIYPKMLIATKVCPTYKTKTGKTGLSREGIMEQFNESLTRLNMDKVDLLYLHWPDYKVDIKESLKAINDLYVDGKFKRFGLSNYSSWQVAQTWHICDNNSWVKPVIYQGMYNALTRAVETELFKCLRYYGINFYVYNPLAGGILTGKHKYTDNEGNTIQNGRFKGKAKWAQAYRNRFWKKEYFDAVDNVQKLLKQENKGLSVVDASLIWLMNHSMLKPGDGVILGAGSMKHFEQNIAALQNDIQLSDQVSKPFNLLYRYQKLQTFYSKMLFKSDQKWCELRINSCNQDNKIKK